MDGPTEVVFESSSNWSWLYELLERIPEVVSITLANPYQTRLMAKAQIKTDKLDARRLAMLLRGRLIARCHVPSRATRDRKEVLRQRVFWVKQRTRIRNRIHRLLGRQHDVLMPQVTDLFGKKEMRALKQARLPSPDQELLEQNLEVLIVRSADREQSYPVFLVSWKPEKVNRDWCEFSVDYTICSEV